MLVQTSENLKVSALVHLMSWFSTLMYCSSFVSINKTGKKLLISPQNGTFNQFVWCKVYKQIDQVISCGKSTIPVSLYSHVQTIILYCVLKHNVIHIHMYEIHYDVFVTPHTKGSSCTNTTSQYNQTKLSVVPQSYQMK